MARKVTKEKKRDYDRRYYERHKEKVRAAAKQYATEHPDSVRATKHAYYEANKSSWKERAARPEACAKKRILDAAYRATHKDEIAAYKKAWNAKNRARLKAAKAAKYQANITEERAKRAEWRAANPEKKRAGDRASYQRHKAKRAAQKTIYNKLNADKIKAAKARYRNKHPEIGRMARYKRRVVLRNTPKSDLREVAAWERTWRTSPDVQCAYCFGTFPGQDCHLEHKIPLSRGGPHNISNVRISCGPCNLAKFNLTDIEYAWKTANVT